MGSFMKALGRRSTYGSEVAVRRSRSRFNSFDSADQVAREKRVLFMIMGHSPFFHLYHSCSHDSDMYKHVLREGSRVSTDSASQCMVRDVWQSSVCRSGATFKPSKYSRDETPQDRKQYFEPQKAECRTRMQFFKH